MTAPAPETVAAALAKLTKAQREALLTRPGRWWWGDTPACMPHRESTAFALKRRGLCVGSGTAAWPLTPLGLALRQAIIEQENSRADRP